MTTKTAGNAVRGRELKGMFRRVVDRGRDSTDWLMTALSTSEPSTSGRWLARAWLLALFIGGGLTWFYFLNGGSIDFSLHDWAEVTGHRYAFLQDAARKGLPPLHMPGAWALRNVTDRFISVADTNLSPQVYLLRFMDLGRFFLFNTLLLYSVGFLGLLLLRRRFRLSPLTFTVLILLFFFGGHIAIHLSVGHANWVAYFLTPYFLWLIFGAIDGPRHPWRWTLYLSIYMFVIFLQGAFHLFVASVILLGLLALSYRERFGLVLRGLVCAALLSAVRMLPPLLHVSDFDSAFLSGFTTVGELLEGLLNLVPPRAELVFRNNPLSPLGWWELDYFVGALGLLFIVAFVAYWWRQSGDAASTYRRLLLPLAVMIALAVGRTYKLFHILQVPLLSSQRVSSRLLFLPLSLLILLGAIGFQQLLDHRRTRTAGRIALALGVALLAHDLWQHFKLWRVANMGALFSPAPVDLSLDIVANHADPLYICALVIGLLVSIATLLVLCFLSWKEARRGGIANRPKQPQTRPTTDDLAG
jgi:hypothetical protein